MQSVQAIRILVVDYHNIVCSGIAEILRGYSDFDVIGHAESGEVAFRLCEKHQPDVVTVDVNLPGEVSGIDLVRMLHSKHPQTRIVVLTNNAEELTINDALRAGATSYLLKNISAEELAHAIRTAVQGQSTLSPEITQILIRALTTPNPVRPNLTHREHQVLELITQGRTNHEIAGELNISLSTVQFHVSNILSKLGVHSRIEAATVTIRQELGDHPAWFMHSS